MHEDFAVCLGPGHLDLSVFSAQVLKFGFDSNTCKKMLACVLDFDIFSSLNKKTYKARVLELPKQLGKKTCPSTGQKPGRK